VKKTLVMLIQAIELLSQKSFITETGAKKIGTHPEFRNSNEENILD